MRKRNITISKLESMEVRECEDRQKIQAEVSL